MKIFTVIIGGRAGQGIRKAGTVISKIFRDMRRYVFQMDDYPSLIKGGHNFVSISASEEKIYSHYMKANLVIAFDERSYNIHKNHLREGGIMIFDESVKGEGVAIPLMEKAKSYSNPLLISGIASVAILSSLIGVEKDRMLGIIEKEYPRNKIENMNYASQIYDIINDKLGHVFKMEPMDRKRYPLLTGNEAVALGMVAAGLDIYFAYPMTPSTSILHFLSRYANHFGVAVMQPENEIAVANMAIGASFAGARVAVGSSGGGFALMQEAFSMAGMVESPVLFVLSSRPGPSTGVPTYTEQADILFAIHQGHGDFPRIVASPGTISEAFSLAGEMLHLVWKFQVPGVLLLDKHISESRCTAEVNAGIKQIQPEIHKSGDYRRYRITENGISPLLFPPSKEMIKWNSYEHDEAGINTEDAEMGRKMHDKRFRKFQSIVDYLRGVKTLNVYGEGETTIFTFGSTTMSVLEAVKIAGVKAKVVQPIYLEPFPCWEMEKYKEGIVVEQNVSGQFARLLKERCSISVKSVIKKYDGRPFDVEELAEQIKEVI